MSVASLPGCAIHYYDEKTGIEHLVGLGHMKMKVSEPNEGVRAVVTGMETFGVAVGTTPEGGALTAGWNRTTRLHVEDDTTVRLEGKGRNLFSVNVGTKFPLLSEEASSRRSDDKMIQKAQLEESVDEEP